MDRLGHQEGDVIEHPMVTKSIERAQRRVEEQNFGVRKRLLEYDNVMNQQREIIYARRRDALYKRTSSPGNLRSLRYLCRANRRKNMLAIMTLKA